MRSCGGSGLEWRVGAVGQRQRLLFHLVPLMHNLFTVKLLLNIAFIGIQSSVLKRLPFRPDTWRNHRGPGSSLGGRTCPSPTITLKSSAEPTAIGATLGKRRSGCFNDPAAWHDGLRLSSSSNSPSHQPYARSDRAAPGPNYSLGIDRIIAARSEERIPVSYRGLCPLIMD